MSQDQGANLVPTDRVKLIDVDESNVIWLNFIVHGRTHFRLSESMKSDSRLMWLSFVLGSDKRR